MEQSTTVQNVTNTSADVVGNAPTKNKKLAVTLDRTAFGDITKANQIQTKTIVENLVGLTDPAIFNLSGLQPATKYTAYVDYVTGNSNVPTNIEFLNIEVKYVSLGVGENTVCVSADGIDWVGGKQDVFSISGKCGIWTGSKWLIGGCGTNILASSSDGKAWNCVRDGPLSLVNGVSFNPSTGRCVAVGLGTDTSILYSDNLTVWTKCSNVTLSFGNDVATNGFIFVAVGDGIYFSYDGENWRKSATSPQDVQYKVIWNGTYWISFGETTLNISTDGITWTSSSNIHKLKHASWNGNNKWIAISTDKTSTSTDGSTWDTPVTLSNLNSIQTITYGDKLVCGIDSKSTGKTTLYHSTDNGTSWVESQQVLNINVFSIAYKRVLPHLPNGNTDSAVTCPIMNTITQTTDGFVLNISNIEFTKQTNYTRFIGALENSTNLNTTLYTNIDYGFVIKENRIGTTSSYLRQIGFILNGYIVYSIRDVFYMDINSSNGSVIGSQSFDTITPINLAYDSSLHANSVSLLERLFRDKTNEKLSSVTPLTSNIVSSYTTSKTQFEYDSKYVYSKYIDRNPSDGNDEYFQIASRVVDSRTGIVNYVNSGIDYFSKKYSQYTDVQTNLNEFGNHIVIFKSNTSDGPVVDNCKVSVVCKNGIVSYYFNDSLILLVRQPFSKINKVFNLKTATKATELSPIFEGSVPQLTVSFGTSTADSILSRKVYGHSLFFDNLLSTTEKDFLFYNLFFKTLSDLTQTTLNTVKTYDLSIDSNSKIFTIFSLFMNILKGTSVSLVTSSCCSMYSAINAFKDSIKTEIPTITQKYSSVILTHYNDLRTTFNDLNSRFNNLKNTIGLLILSSEITSLNTECESIIQRVQSAISVVNINQLNSILVFIETANPLLKNLADLITIYENLGDPITPATLTSILLGFNDGNGGGWSTTYFLNITPEFLTELQTDNRVLIEKTIDYLRTQSDSTTGYPTGTPAYSTITNDLKTYFKNRYSLVESVSEQFSDVSKIVLNSYTEVLNSTINTYTNTVIDEFLDVYTDIFSPQLSSAVSFGDIGLDLGQLISTKLHILDRPQTVLNDIVFTVSSPLISTTQLTISKGVYTLSELVSNFQTQIQTVFPNLNVTLDSNNRIYIDFSSTSTFDIVFDRIESANALGFVDTTANRNGLFMRSENPIFMNYYKFKFYLDRLAFLIKSVDSYTNRTSVLTAASNASKIQIDNYFKFIVETRFYPFVLSRISQVNSNIDDIAFVNAENDCTSGELSTKRTLYLTKKTQIETLVTAGVNVSDLYSNVQTVNQSLSDIETIHTYFTEARAGFQKYHSTITFLDTAIDSYRESLQRELRMTSNYIRGSSPDIVLYTGIGEDFIRSVLPTDTRFWTLQSGLNKLDYAEFRLNWPYYDQDIVVYNGQVYKCTGLAIHGILPTDTRYWKLEPTYQAVKFPNNAYSADQRYTHYSTVTYNNNVYSCIYDFPTDGLVEYRLGNQYTAYSTTYGNTKLQDFINRLGASNFRLENLLNGIEPATSGNRTPFMVSLFFEQFSYDPEYIAEQLTHNRLSFLNDQMNTLADKVMIVTEESDKPLYDERVTLGDTRTDVLNRFQEIFSSSIYNQTSSAAVLLKQYQTELLNNKELIVNSQGTPTYSVTGIKAEYLYNVGYKGDTSNISLNTYPGAVDSLGFKNVIESKNTRTTVQNYNPTECPYVWKLVEDKRFYDSNAKYRINDIVYEFDGTTLRCFRCKSVNLLTNNVLNISPLENTVYWESIQLISESDIQIKQNTSEKQYIVNDNVFFVNGSVIEKYTCINDCNGTIPVSNTTHWLKDTTYVSSANIYDQNTNYSLGNLVFVPNYLSFLFDKYICVNVDVPIKNAFDCVIQYQSTIQNVSPSESSLLWEIQTTLSDKVYSSMYFSMLNLSDTLVENYLFNKREIPYSSQHEYKVGNLVLHPDTSVQIGESVDIKTLRFRGTSNFTPPRTSDYSDLRVNDVVTADDSNTYVWNGTTWVKKFRIRCYKCIRAPDNFGYYSYYDGSYKTPGVPCYGIGPKSDMWRQRFFPRIARYNYALFVDHPRIEVTEKYDKLLGYFQDNSDKDFRSFTFKCPNASTLWTSMKNKFLNSRSELRTPPINYSILTNKLLYNFISEIDNVYSIIVDYRTKINDLKQQFFETDIVQQIVNKDETKYDLVNIDAFRYIDLGYGSRETSLEPKFLSDDMLETFNSNLQNTIQLYAVTRGLRTEEYLELELEKIRNNQKLIVEYETSIEHLMSYVNDLIGFDFLESVLNSKDEGTINYGIGGVCDGIVIPLRGIDIQYSFLSSWTRFDTSGNMSDSTAFGDILTNKYKLLGTNTTILPAYKLIDLTPKAASWTDMFRGFILGSLVGLIGIGSLVPNPNQLRKQSYMRNRNLWKNRKLAHQQSARRSVIPGIVPNVRLFYKDNISAYNSEIISSARNVLVQEDINRYHIDLATAAHTAMISAGVSNLLEAQVQIESYTKTIEFEIVVTREKRTALAQNINKAENLDASVLSLESGKTVVPVVSENSPPVKVSDPPTNTSILSDTPATPDPPVPPPETVKPPNDIVGKMEQKRGQIEPTIRRNNVPGTAGKYAKAADGAVAFRGAGSAPTRILGTGDPKTFIQNGSRPQNFSGNGPPVNFADARARLRKTTPDPPSTPAETSSSVKTVAPEQVIEKPTIAFQEEVKADIRNSLKIQEETIPEVNTSKQEANISAKALKVKEAELAALPANDPIRPTVETEVARIRGEYTEKVSVVKAKVSNIAKAGGTALSVFQLGLTLASFKDMTPAEGAQNAAMMVGMAVVGGVLSKVPGANVAFAGLSIAMSIMEQEWVDDTLY